MLVLVVYGIHVKPWLFGYEQEKTQKRQLVSQIGSVISVLYWCVYYGMHNSYQESILLIVLFSLISELRVAFAMFDADGDGFITSTELTEVMRSLGMDTNTKKAQEMITKVDLDGERLVSSVSFLFSETKKSH